MLHRAKKDGNILNRTKRRKVSWIDHILHRNCLLKHHIKEKVEGRIEMTGRRVKRLKQLLVILRKWKDPGK
jgi:hypothetical protein